MKTIEVLKLKIVAFSFIVCSAESIGSRVKVGKQNLLGPESR